MKNGLIPNSTPNFLYWGSVNTPQNNNMKPLTDIPLPYFGIPGTIHSLWEETGPKGCYYKKLYDPFGGVRCDMIPIPKKGGRNLLKLKGDLNADRQRYLSANQAKYLEPERKTYSKIKFTVLLVADVLFSVISLQLLLSTAWLGLLLSTISMLALYNLVETGIKDAKYNIELKAFKQTYERIQQEVIGYLKEKEKTRGTEKNADREHQRIRCKIITYSGPAKPKRKSLQKAA